MVPDLEPPHPKPVIGVTGGIASGKSSVARRMAELGAAVIDSDRLAHEQLNEPHVIEQLRSWWGDSVSSDSGEIDRRLIASVVFAAPEELRRLEELLYPLIEGRRKSLMESYMADPGVPAVVLESPKLFEVGLDKICNVVVVVESERAKRLERVATQRGWTEKELSRRENLLKPLDSQMSNADYTIVNQLGLAELCTEVDLIFSKIMAPYSKD